MQDVGSEAAPPPPPVRPLRRRVTLDEAGLETLRTKIVQYVLDLRRVYLRTGQANVLKHWEILQTRMESAARRTGRVEAWASEVQRNLQVVGADNSLSSSLIDLAGYVRETGCTDDFFQVVSGEIALVMALSRKSAEEAADKAAEEREAREASGTTDRPATGRKARR